MADFSDRGSTMDYSHLYVPRGRLFVFRPTVAASACEDDWTLVKPDLLTWLDDNAVEADVHGQGAVILSDQPDLERKLVLFKIRWC